MLSTIPSSGDEAPMATPNYKFAKRQRDLAKQSKQDKKREKRQAQKGDKPEEPGTGSAR
jgi:hypothetical protein